MTTIALVGATGAIGNSIATTLRQDGTPYRAIGRNRQTLEAEFGSDPLAEIVVWNPDDPASVRAAMKGIETAIYLVGVPYDQFQLHPQLMRKTLDGAIAEGVAKMLLIGNVYPFGRPQTPKVSESHPRDPHTFKGKMRKEQEDLLMAADATGKIHGTILRLPDFYGAGTERSIVAGVFKSVRTGKAAQLVGPIDTPHEFVFIPDVGPIVRDLIAMPQAFGRTWNLAGASVITQRQFAEKAFAQAGVKRKLMVAGTTLLRILGWFQPLMRELVEMAYLQQTPVLLDDTDLRKLLPNMKKTSYDEGIRQILRS
jgi:nucleoside-diphosphate-sugar epimerase